MESFATLERLIGMTSAVDPITDSAALRADNEFLRQQIQQLLATVAELRSLNAKQQAHIDYLVRITFGRKSERLEGPTLFDDVPDAEPAPTPPEPPAAAEPEITVAGHKRRGHGRKPLPKDLPRQSHEVDLSEPEKLCPCCGHLRGRIGADVSERLDYHPASLFIRATVRPKYACSHCERQGDSPQVVQPPLPPEPIPRGIAAPGLLSYLLVSKYVDHLPLYRQENIFARLGWDVSRSTLCDLTMRCGHVLLPLYAWMCRRVLQSCVLHTDDTKITLLDPLRTAHAWVYCGEAFTYATNQWPTLTVYATDGRLKIDNHPAEQAIRPLAIGRRNWLHLGGDGGMQPAAVLLSLAASAKRHTLNPWEYFKHILTALPARPPNADLTDLLPDVWARSCAGPATATG